MLYVISPVNLKGYSGELLVYDTDDLTAEFHCVADIKNALINGIFIDNAYITARNELSIETLYFLYVGEMFRLSCRDGIVVDVVEHKSWGTLVIVIQGGMNCLVFAIKYGNIVLGGKGKADYSYDSLLTPPVLRNGRLGFYLGRCEDGKEVVYDWYDFSTSGLVLHSQELCSRIKKMLMFAKTDDEKFRVLSLPELRGMANVICH